LINIFAKYDEQNYISNKFKYYYVELTLLYQIKTGKVALASKKLELKMAKVEV